ncbi:hypothetical protein DL764_004026 [Monosporascus ibericus]|uniref:Uncharacterized protein n=1 Tax=Monosporascus ibericus TaxID=155417 RepID=A0A4Q4THV2_9PEZI|nr:hypothetical protein DL764_004026 [Monosporascus ibericus]
MDGESLGIFLECLAAQTRQGSIDRPSEQKIALAVSKHYKDPGELRAQFHRLAAKCPEFTLLPDLSGPTQPKLLGVGTPLHEIGRTGRIFVFSNGRLEALKRLVTSHASSSGSSPTLPTTCYCALAALTFAHVTRARVGAERHLPASRCNSSMENPGPTTTAQLWNSVNWRARAFQAATRDYFGNAALPAVTETPACRLFAACGDDSELARIVPLIRETIDRVNQTYVHRRLAMLAAAPDPRLIGVRYDPRLPEVLTFNTWRHFGADAAWHIPGVPVAKPDAIRRAHGSWGMGTALILPAQAESTKQELFLSLSVEAMEALCNDERWMHWVDRVIG